MQPRDFNSYGSRRGNHEVMMRGTFANIRLRNLLAPGDARAGSPRAPSRSGEQMSIYDAAMRYAEEDVPLVVIGGREYGSGSSRDWAAKGTSLLGVRAVIAESFERIHRSNLIGMGVLPLQFPHGASAQSLGIDGREPVTISGFAEPLNEGELPRTCTVKVGEVELEATVRIDTPKEADYFRHGGILQYVAARAARLMNAQTEGGDEARIGGMEAAETEAAAMEAAAMEAAEMGGFPAFLRDLLLAKGPSGYETAPAAVWRAAAEAFGAQVDTDVVGTPSARVAARGAGQGNDVSPEGGLARAREESPLHARAREGRCLVVMGHIDEIGLIVTHIDDEGFLRVRRGRRLGPADPRRPARRAAARASGDAPGRDRQQADPPAARGGAQEGPRDARAAHRHRRRRRRGGARARARSATSR